MNPLAIQGVAGAVDRFAVIGYGTVYLDIQERYYKGARLRHCSSSVARFQSLLLHFIVAAILSLVFDVNIKVRKLAFAIE
ncbi:unnamed protein product [Strongylus vulgaris]|uniref:Uncharacterized protein n=1 Tax=Strongylus vulgaris TaxID=40348 RepID=A0A3P7JKP1_STRVU|nr:unnamed protein product [Strongylus vulgaris]